MSWPPEHEDEHASSTRQTIHPAVVCGEGGISSESAHSFTPSRSAREENLEMTAFVMQPVTGFHSNWTPLPFTRADILQSESTGSAVTR